MYIEISKVKFNPRLIKQLFRNTSNELNEVWVDTIMWTCFCLTLLRFNNMQYT